MCQRAPEASVCRERATAADERGGEGGRERGREGERDRRERGGGRERERERERERGRERVGERGGRGNYSLFSLSCLSLHAPVNLIQERNENTIHWENHFNTEENTNTKAWIRP